MPPNVCGLFYKLVVNFLAASDGFRMIARFSLSQGPTGAVVQVRTTGSAYHLFRTAGGAPRFTQKVVALPPFAYSDARPRWTEEVVGAPRCLYAHG